jgi:signal transduction histidine kinase
MRLLATNHGEQSLEICALFKTCIDSVKSSLSSQQTLVTAIPQPCSHFVGDQHLITGLFTEPIANAIRFSPDEGTITCRLWIDSTQADISIADEGRGCLSKTWIGSSSHL